MCRREAEVRRGAFGDVFLIGDFFALGFINSLISLEVLVTGEILFFSWDGFFSVSVFLGLFFCGDLDAILFGDKIFFGDLGELLLFGDLGELFLFGDFDDGRATLDLVVVLALLLVTDFLTEVVRIGFDLFLT